MKISENSEGLSIFLWWKEILQFSQQHPVEDRDLTVKQRKLFGLGKQGMRNKEIASVLHISERTVKWHMHLILSARGVERRQDL